MKQLMLSIAATLLLALVTTAQGLPQFNTSDFEGWSYSNPGIELTATSISRGQVCLYVNSRGEALTLTSPAFSCNGIDSIVAQVSWLTRYFSLPQFDLERTALTLAIDDASGLPVDSMTCTPTTAGTSTHLLRYALPVPQGLGQACVRLVSWDADVTSCGAVKWIILDAVTGGNAGKKLGDLDEDGVLSVSDVTSLISMVLNGSSHLDRTVADIDQDGEVSISDVTLLISKVLYGN